MEISSEFENEKIESSSADEIVLYTSKNTIVKKFRTFGKWQVSKEIAPEFAFDAKHRQSINQEFEIGYQLDHPNIVRYIDKKEYENGVPRLVMEYIDGFTLRELIDGETPVTQRDFDSIFSSILSALAYLHRRQIYHLDIKPENIIVTHKEHVAKLIDFGFAITSSNEKTLGTSKKYVAPEFSERTDDISGKTDMYAFAKTMQELAEAKKLLLSKRQRQIIKSALEGNANARITADEALTLLQKPQRKGWFIVILFVVLAIVVSIVATHGKKQKTAPKQTVSDTFVTETQQIIDSLIRDTIPNRTNSIEKRIIKTSDRVQKRIVPSKQLSPVDSSILQINESYIHYNEEDSLFVTNEYARCKACVDALSQELEEKLKELKKQQSQGKIVFLEVKWESEKYKDATLDCSNNMNRTIQKHLQHYVDEGNKKTYDYYSYEFIKKLMNNTIPF